MDHHPRVFPEVCHSSSFRGVQSCPDLNKFGHSESGHLTGFEGCSRVDSESVYEVVRTESSTTAQRLLRALDDLMTNQDQLLSRLTSMHDQALARLHEKHAAWIDRHEGAPGRSRSHRLHSHRHDTLTAPSRNDRSLMSLLVESPPLDGGDLVTEVSSCATTAFARASEDTKPSVEGQSTMRGSETVVTATTTLGVFGAKPEWQRKTSMNIPRVTDVGRVKSKSSGAANAARFRAVRKFVRSSLFDQITAALVISNALFIGVQVEALFDGQPSRNLLIVDSIFCFAFISELTLRLFACGRYEYFFGEDHTWNWFDFIVVGTSTVDTFLSLFLTGDNSPLGSVSILRTLRIVRITRVLRIIRVMKFFKDLRIMTAAISSTLKTATWALVLLLIAMYMFGVAIAQIVAESVQDEKEKGTQFSDNDAVIKYWGSLAKTLFTLFTSIAGGIDWENAATPLFNLPISLVIYIFFILFASFCVMNVLTGIFCQNAMETFENDKENLIECQLAEKTRYIQTLTKLFTEWDTSGDGTCTREEFERHISDPRMQVLLRTLDIEQRDALTLFSMMDVDGTGCLDLDEFVHGCITLRGSAKAVHMERALVDNKLTITKLDWINEQLREIQEKLKIEGIKHKKSRNVDQRSDKSNGNKSQVQDASDDLRGQAISPRSSGRSVHALPFSNILPGAIRTSLHIQEFD